MTGDPARDAEATEHNFADGEDNDYAAAKQAETEKSQPALVYCKHMDMDVYEGTCAMCTPPEPERVTGHLMARTQAQYETGCDACDKRIQVGQDIALVEGAWVHIEHWEGP